MAFRRKHMSRGHSKHSFHRGNKIHKKNHGYRVGAMRGGIRL
nr:MAG: hypothetical protein [Microviridae sp.]